VGTVVDATAKKLIGLLVGMDIGHCWRVEGEKYLVRRDILRWGIFFICNREDLLRAKEKIVARQVFFSRD
jgi:hypothetical protein